MRYLEFLGQLHTKLVPRTYLEIGIRTGNSLALARCRSVGIDPAFNIKAEVRCHAQLFRTTSDEYFVDTEPLAALNHRAIDLAFIDGMHLFEYALRDFVNVERWSRWTSVVVFDDVMPRHEDEAARDRHTMAWTGDVYKVWLTLREHRPDLVLLPINTQPTGLLLVLGMDPQSSVLDQRYDELIAEYVVPDPQSVPAELIDRIGALPPDQVLAAPFWNVLRTVRAARLPRALGMPLLLRALRNSFPELERPFAGTGDRRPAGVPG